MDFYGNLVPHHFMPFKITLLTVPFGPETIVLNHHLMVAVMRVN